MNNSKIKMFSILLCGCLAFSIAQVIPANLFETKTALAESINEESLNYDYEVDFLPTTLNQFDIETSTNESNLDNKISTIYSSSDEICQSILSNETFSIQATVVDGERILSANEYYDFSQESKYQIAEWACNIGAITETEAISCMCDLILSKNFDNIGCLENVIDRIREYSNNNALSNELTAKTNAILNPLSNSTRTIVSDAVYTNAYFTIHYDSTVDTYAEAQAVGNYFNVVRSEYLEMGFLSPILESGKDRYHVYLDPASNPNKPNSAATTHKMNVSGNTCASYITIWEFTALNDAVRQCIGHEYFHAIQNAYNHQSGWFKEGCANWGAIVSTGMSTFCDGWLNGYIGSTTPMPELTGYEAYALPLTIQRKYGGTSTIRTIYERYHEYSSTSLNLQSLRNMISEGMADNGYNNGFDNAYRSMAGFLYNPSLWFATVHSGSSAWRNRSITTIPITSTSGSYTFTETLDYLTSQYYKIETPASTVCMVNVNVEFTNSDGRIQWYRSQIEGHNIGYPNTTSNKATYADSSIGRFVNYSGFVLSNLGNSGSVTCTVTIQLTPQDEHFTFAGTGSYNSRYAERRMYLIENEYADYTITFTTAGTKLVQTFGGLDTELELYNSSGRLIDSSNDDGYGTNALLSFNTSANSTYRIRVKFHHSTTVGWVRLAITPAYAVKEADEASMSKYEDIKNFTGTSLNWLSYAQNNYTRVITFTPNSTGTYTIELESVFDNYLYVIDPRSSNAIVPNVDYNDDGGGNGQAKITRTLEKNVPYLIIYSQWNLSASFTNLDEGDDLRVRISKN